MNNAGKNAKISSIARGIASSDVELEYSKSAENRSWMRGRRLQADHRVGVIFL